MSNRVEPEIPSISIAHDQVKPSHAAPKGSPKQESTTQPAPSKANGIFTVLIYLVLAGASWFFYQENLKLQALISSSENRIQQLENQLSATGEEMGESTIALKAKLEAITEKTEKLWGEMDKLWASAWRRNQSEIKDLRSIGKKQETLNKTQSSQIATTNTAINSINDKLTSNEFNMNALADQITAANNIQTKINQLNASLNTLEEKSSGRDVQQIEIATNVNQLEMQVTLLIERLEKIEREQNKPPAVTLPAAIPVTE